MIILFYLDSDETEQDVFHHFVFTECTMYNLKCNVKHVLYIGSLITKGSDRYHRNKFDVKKSRYE